MLKAYFKKEWPMILVLALAILTRFLFLSYPSQVVFDEVHFGKFVGAYFTHEYYFDIHPPLGKMMIAGFAKIAGLSFGNQSPDQIFAQIGDQFSQSSLFILRFLPALFGVFFVMLIYQLALLLGLSKKGAFLAGFMILFDTAFLVQSKFILVDVFLLVFGFLGLYFFLLSRKSPESSLKNILLLILSAIFCALAFSIKWTALAFWGLIVLWIFISFCRDPNRNFSRLLQKAVIFLIIPFVIYASVFAIHFHLLYKTGPGDAYMSAAFQKTLQGNSISANVQPQNFWQNFLELNRAMYIYNKSITASHPFGSKWYQWPFTQKAIWYWAGSADNQNANIYLLGNPLVWLPVFFGILFAIFSLISRNLRARMPKIVYIFLFAYFCNLLPYIFITRVTFLYHYLPALTFGILIFAIIADRFYLNQWSKQKMAVYCLSLFLIFTVFAALIPLAYGFPVSNAINRASTTIMNF